MDNGKSPGSDEFKCEFYKFFWDCLKQNVTESINYGFEKRQLSTCQRNQFLKSGPKLSLSRTLNRKFHSAESNAFSKSKKTEDCQYLKISVIRLTKSPFILSGTTK